MFKDMVTEGSTDSATDGIVHAFDDRTGETFVEVVEKFIPPMLKGLRELYQLSNARSLGFIYPGT